jgi:predicted nucleic acid-binding Zn ribbon protein
VSGDEPVEPLEPVDPVDPLEPVEPVEPAQPADPAEAEAEADAADAVRAALGRARAAAAARGVRPGQPAKRLSPAAAAARARRRGADQRSGSGPDARDPQSLGTNINRLVTDRGWSTPVSVGGVLGRWPAVVGEDVAAHCRPLSFADGVLTVAADSSAWATQVRLLVPTVMRRLAEEVGEGTVERIVVKGPAAPSWRRGPRVAPGSQGPRDTYG